MTFEQALSYIDNINRLGSNPGLGRITHLLNLMGNPQRRLRFVHIAGTNGKGSTTMLTAAVLTAAGYKAGAYISPGVLDFRERMQIDGGWIPPQAVADILEDMIPLIEQTRREVGTHPTEFEIMTALAFRWYLDEGCDIVALEVGMGGRLDSTNVIDPPLCAAITSISFDHAEVLGDTLEKIAYEKCGILKPGSPAVCYCRQPAPVLATIQNICRERGIPLKVADERLLTVHSSGLSGSIFRYREAEWELSAVGRHQIRNALTVLEILSILRDKGLRIPDADIASAFRNFRFAGRQEIVLRCPAVLVDGSHNRDGIERLCETLDESLEDRRLIAVMGMFADKDYRDAIPMVARRASVFFAARPERPRALPADAVAETAKPHCGDVRLVPRVQDALCAALAEAGPEDAVIVCGSLSMVLPAHEVLDPMRPDAGY